MKEEDSFSINDVLFYIVALIGAIVLAFVVYDQKSQTTTAKTAIPKSNATFGVMPNSNSTDSNLTENKRSKVDEDFSRDVNSWFFQETK